MDWDAISAARAAMQRERKFRNRTLGQKSIAGTPFDAYFGPPEPEAPVLLFQHIRKTGGTSLRQFVHGNLGALRHEWGDLPRSNTPTGRLADWYAGWLAGLEPTERVGLRCFVSHSANYLTTLLDRPVRCFTMVRRPVERIQSKLSFENGDRRWLGDLNELYAAPAFRPKRADFFNGQSRSLLEPHYDLSALAFTEGPGPDADLWRTRLWSLVDERYVIGLQDRFEESLALFARAFGWHEETMPPVHRKGGKSRAERPGLVPSLRERIEAFNWLDCELYERISGAISHQVAGR